MQQNKRLITPGGVDTAMAPYSPGLAVGDLVFVSGQGPLDPRERKFILNSIEEQTELTLRNVQSVLESAGCTMNDCVKSTVHLADIAMFDRFNVVYKKFFKKPYPCRTTVQSVLAAGIGVEIDMIAVRGSGANSINVAG